MPSTPLIDPTTLDFTQLAAGRTQIDARLKQRGRFSLVDGVLAQKPDSKVIVGFKELHADDWWTTDHIPGRPIFPGVLMIEGAAQLCSFDYLVQHHEGEDVFLGFGGTNETRFRGLVVPPGRLVFAGEVRRVRKTLFTYYAQAFYADELVFESEIMGVVV